MCGFNYLYDSTLDSNQLKNLCINALERIRHRGPDEEGMWCNLPVVMGHRRLSIIDLTTSQQPMTDPTGRYVLAFNGEIYNYKKLREKLAQKWRFRTNGDTEVVLAGLIIQGRLFLQEMEGMWAFSFWDTQSRSLLLSRDRMGKKPLFFQKSSLTRLSCASELGALAALSDTPWQEDYNSTADYLRYGYYLPGKTIYKDICEVLPGHTLTWTPGKEPEHIPYWSLSLNPFNGSKQEARIKLHDALVNAVESRLVSDVEVGAFLSGGIDSSLIVGLLRGVLQKEVKTFTIGFKEKSYDERVYAQKIAELYETEHYERLYDSWDRERLVSLILNHVGQPFSDSSLLPTAMVSELASQKVKVALSGDGGDELFSGYQRYQARALLRWYTRLPKPLQRSAEHLIKSLPEPMDHHSRSLLKKAHLFIDIVRRQEDERPYTAPLMYTRQDFKSLVPDLANSGHPAPGLPTRSCEDSIQEMMVADALVYLPQDILTKVDRASMAFSLEARAPFLDRKVVELAFSIPPHWHRRGMRGKRMLSETFQDLLPQNIWHRRKQGFAVPIHQWFREKLGGELISLLRSSHSPLSPSTVKRMLRDHQSGKTDHGYRLWNIYLYLLWKERQGNG